MLGRRDFLCSGAALVASGFLPPSDPATNSHVIWVGKVLEEMLSIRPGMTRDDLLRVFRTEGGLSIGPQRTYVSRQCPYFKVDVTFKAALVEDGKDPITSLSRPYLQFSIMD